MKDKKTLKTYQESLILRSLVLCLSYVYCVIDLKFNPVLKIGIRKEMLHKKKFKILYDTV